MIKSLRKKLIAALTATMALTFALGGCGKEEEPQSTPTGEKFSPSQYLSTVIASDGASKDFGEYAQVINGKTFKGVKLTGGENSVFDLGNIDISQSNWNGTCNAIDGECESFINLRINRRRRK